MNLIAASSADIDALPDQSVIVNITSDESPLWLYDVFQKITDNSWGGHGFINTQTTQELVERYPSGFYVVFSPDVVRQNGDGGDHA